MQLSLICKHWRAIAGPFVQGNARLCAFMGDCQREGLQLTFDERALTKEINADVSVDLGMSLPSGGRISVKFHQRPLAEVVAYEVSTGQVAPVPEGYFQDIQSRE